ncbi:MAG: LacI family DNA-binding transcriptional regulator [Limnochordales bacterium]|nr:LacI family DNA-binding transcriptional regulator [Limnochordales bacterium]
MEDLRAFDHTEDGMDARTETVRDRNWKGQGVEQAMISGGQRGVRSRTGRPTARDVAREAGVSPTAVSFVLTGTHPEKVSAATRKRVLEAVERLGYRPNRVARSLRTHRTGAIGVLLTDIKHPLLARTVSGIQQVARQYGYHVVLHNTSFNPEAEREALQFLADLLVDGIIFVSTSTWGDDSVLLEWTQTPLVLINRALSESIPVPSSLPRVRVDYRAGAKEAVLHLVEQGCRRIAYVGAVLTGPGASLAATERYGGYRDALAEAGLPYLPELVHISSSSRPGWDDGAEAVERFLAYGFDGLYAVNDYAAAGAIGRLLRGGLRVPQDVAVVGNDNTEVASHHSPQITSVDPNWEEAGAVALRLLQSMLDGKEKACESTRGASGEAGTTRDGASTGRDGVVAVRPKLVVRESSRRVG